MRTFLLVITLCFLWAYSCSPPFSGWSHALAVRAEPQVGAAVHVFPPARVRIWFDNSLKVTSQNLRVQNAKGEQSDNEDASVDCFRYKAPGGKPSAPSLRRLPVIWTVVGQDGHKTSGSYTFTIRQPD